MTWVTLDDYVAAREAAIAEGRALRLQRDTAQAEVLALREKMAQEGADTSE